MVGEVGSTDMTTRSPLSRVNFWTSSLSATGKASTGAAGGMARPFALPAGVFHAGGAGFVWAPLLDERRRSAKARGGVRDEKVRIAKSGLSRLVQGFARQETK